MAYLRFVIPQKDVDSGRRQGVFQALAELYDQGALLPHEAVEWTTRYEWFRKNLDEPARFAKANRPHAKRVALSWFRDSASQHVVHMRQLAAILREHGIEVAVIHTDRPGYVVYEDEHQVVAEPFADTPT